MLFRSIRPDGWPDYALKAAQIHPTAIVTAKKTMFVRMNDTNTADFLDILEHCDGARVMDMVASHGGIDALLDIWNCPDEDALKARIDPAHAGCIRCDVRNVTAVGLDIGRCTDIIRKMNQAVSELGVGVIALFTQPNAVTFVVTLDDVAAVSNVLHAFITQ